MANYDGHDYLGQLWTYCMGGSENISYSYFGMARIRLCKVLSSGLAGLDESVDGVAGTGSGWTGILKRSMLSQSHSRKQVTFCLNQWGSSQILCGGWPSSVIKKLTSFGAALGHVLRRALQWPAASVPKCAMAVMTW